MSQHDFSVANQTGALVRADFNSALLAIVSNSSGAAAPATTFSYQWWLDSTNNLLKIRDSSNTSWVTVGTPSVDNLGLLTLAGGTLTGALLAAVGAVGVPGVAFDGDTDTGFYWVSANTWGLVANGTEYLRISSAGITFLGTGATQLPSGTTAQRPGSPVNGMTRYNSDLLVMESFLNGSWKILASAAAYPYAVSDFQDSVVSIGTAAHRSDFGGISSSCLVQAGFPWNSTPTALTAPATLPANDANCVSWSPNGEYLAVGFSTTSPRLHIYKKTGTELVKIADPATVPTGSVQGVAFSPNGQFLACAHFTTPFITIYQRTAGTDTFTKLADPANLPPGTSSNHCSWSPNSEFLVVGSTNASPYIIIYQRSGTTFTKISDPATAPSNNVFSTCWSPNGRFLAVGSVTTTPLTTIYEITNGTTFTKLADPSGINNISGTGGLAFSPSGEFFVICGQTGARVYQISGNTFTAISSIDTSTFRRGASWSPDSKYLSTGTKIWSRSGTTFTTSSTQTVAGQVEECAFSPDGQFIAYAHAVTPFMKVYQTSADMATESILSIKKKFRSGT